ncbi:MULTISPECIES: hypothetical protein [unclassified Streptomyces]|uniref:hypothetical protein n=1 Tax=unclassified Streptomyces TaxID=2593676 RepID=UPI001BE7F00C|nr:MULTISPECIES: hypothetical protein [unclassified Streptomyces]MBT2406550.1 hypothetical protein [Streptomyces sp. ISL-21]MBT2608888.1 hypothetical protein [Streptomyces sp. ISL-87]
MTSPATEPSPQRTRPQRTRPAPWVRTRLRTAPLTALLAAALAFVAVLLAAGLPRALDQGSDKALRAFLHRQGPGPTSLFATATPQYGAQTPQDLDDVLSTLRARTGPDFALAADGAVHGTRAMKPRALATPGLARPEGVDPVLNLFHLRESAAHTRLVDGRWPSGGAADGPIPVALSKNAADTLGAKVGTVMEAVPSISGPISTEVVGVYTVNDPAEGFWTDLLCLTRACPKYTDSREPKKYWQVSALVGPDGLGRLAPWGERAEDFWRLPVDTGALRADRLPAVRGEVAAYVAGPTATALAGETGRRDLRITSQLPELFTRARARQQAAAPLSAIGPAGVAGVALVVFCLAAGLTGDRREAELRLLRARGGSRRDIVRRVLAESAVTVLPATALATWLAVLLLPTPRLTASLITGASVGLVALLAFPVRAFVLLSPRRGPAPRRRLVAELLVLAATAAAVFEVRSRGINPAGDDLDPLLVAAPLLIALSGGLLLARVQPLLVGALARAAGRRSGLIGFLGLARAARGTGGRARPSVLPLIALLLAVITGGFGATVLSAVDTARLQVARLGAGGDAQIAPPAGVPVSAALAKAADALPGVRASLALWRDTDGYVFDTQRGSVKATVVVADPVTYAEIARTVGRGQFDPAVLSGGSPESIPALFSKDLVAQADGGVYRVRFADGEELRAKAAGVIDGTPALPDGKAIVVLPAGPATAQYPKSARPTHWLAVGAIDDAELHALVRANAPAEAADNYLVKTSAAASAELASDPLQRSADRLFWASVAGAAGFALLSVLLTLVRAAPERAALLARLRTMGLRPRQGMALILAEALPQAIAAAAGGGLLAATAVALLGPAVDLTTLVGSPVPTGLHLLARPLLTQTLGLAALVTAAVCAEAAISGRRQITTELRAGDQR